MTSKCRSTRLVRLRGKKSKRPVELSRCVKSAELEKAKQTTLRLKRSQRPRSRKPSRGLRKRNRARRRANDFGVPKYGQDTGAATANIVYAGRYCNCAFGRRDHDAGCESGSFAGVVSHFAQPAHRRRFGRAVQLVQWRCAGK